MIDGMFSNYISENFKEKCREMGKTCQFWVDQKTLEELRKKDLENGFTKGPIVNNYLEMCHELQVIIQPSQNEKDKGSVKLKCRPNSACWRECHFENLELEKKMTDEMYNGWFYKK